MANDRRRTIRDPLLKAMKADNRSCVTVGDRVRFSRALFCDPKIQTGARRWNGYRGGN
jgi:hypothetical protein